MSKAAELWNAAWARIKAEPNTPRIPIRIPDDHVQTAPPTPADKAGGDGYDVVRPQKDYVIVTLNQMYLTHSREWFTTIEPSMFSSVEFTYDGKDRTDPVVVGPRPDEKLPPGMVLRNLTLFGPHKYTGGAFTFTFVLSRLPVGNVARQVLEVVEATSKAIVPTLPIDTYTRIGGVVMDGVERLMGLNGVHPLIGWRETFNPDTGEDFRPGYWALIDVEKPAAGQFWVINNELWHGTTQASAEPYRATDFMLIHFARTASRTDTDRLPFYTPWKLAQEAASRASAWDEAKGNFVAMQSAINISPDVTWEQGNALKAERKARLLELHKEAQDTQAMNFTRVADGDREASAILDLT